MYIKYWKALHQHQRGWILNDEHRLYRCFYKPTPRVQKLHPNVKKWFFVSGVEQNAVFRLNPTQGKKSASIRATSHLLLFIPSFIPFHTILLWWFTWKIHKKPARGRNKKRTVKWSCCWLWRWLPGDIPRQDRDRRLTAQSRRRRRWWAFLPWNMWESPTPRDLPEGLSSFDVVYSLFSGLLFIVQQIATGQLRGVPQWIDLRYRP